MHGRSMLCSALFAALLAPCAQAGDRFEIDSRHTYPSLEMRHGEMSIWRGKFNKSSGTIELDRGAKTGQVDVRIETASIDFGLDAMNEHALADDWLNPKQFPEIRYQGKLVFDGDTPNAVDGELTLLGVSKPVRIAIGQFKCVVHDEAKLEVCGADALAELHRGDFGLTRWAEGDAGKILVRIQVEARREIAAAPAAAAAADS